MRALEGIIDHLLSTQGVDINATDGWGRTALHLAASNNDLESCKQLVEAGADPKIQDEDYFTASSYALDVETSDMCSSRRIPDKLRHRHKPPIDKTTRASAPGGLAFNTSSLTSPPVNEIAEDLADEMVNLLEGGLDIKDEEIVAYHMNVLEGDPSPPKTTKNVNSRWEGKSRANNFNSSKRLTTEEKEQD